jgi:hypothetical protein
MRRAVGGGTIRAMAPWLSVVVPLLSAVVGASVGGLVVHRFTAVRDARNAQRSLRIEHLVSAYRRLIAVSNREALDAEQRAALESALSDVVLLGQRAEVDEAEAFMVGFAESRLTSLDQLLLVLRSSLRSEVKLADLPMPSRYVLRLR